MFFLLYRHTDDRIVDDFPKISDQFLRISEDSPKLVWRSQEHCWIFSGELLKITEDFQRLPKTFEGDPRMFRSYTNEFKNNLRDKLDISEILDIFTSEDVENMPLESWMWFCMNFMSGVFFS